MRGFDALTGESGKRLPPGHERARGELKGQATPTLRGIPAAGGGLLPIAAQTVSAAPVRSALAPLTPLSQRSGQSGRRLPSLTRERRVEHQ